MNYDVNTDYTNNEKIDSINIDNIIDYLLLKKLIDNRINS